MDSTQTIGNQWENCATPERNEQFRATRLWKEVVNEFRERIIENRAVNVTSGTSTPVLWRTNYFSGYEAVETLFSVLAEKQENLGLKEITREKAVKFCECLLRDWTITSAPENKERNRFQATKYAFYYFSDDPYSSMQDIAGNRTWPRGAVPVSGPNSVLGSSRLSLASSENEFGNIDHKIMREFALSRLLMLVDVPILEEILEIRSFHDSSSLLKMLENLLAGVSKLKLDRSNVLMKESSFEEVKTIENSQQWLTAGNKCIRRCLGKGDPQSTPSKESVYGAVISAYKNVTSKHGSLIPRQYEEVLRQVSSLLGTKTESYEAKALEACQCLCLLLSPEIRGQLRSLLQFITAIRREECPDEKAFKDFLDKDDIFWKFIFPKEAQDHGRLMEFFVDRSQEILICPKDYLQQIYYNHTILPDSFDGQKPQISFCKRITREEYKNQQLSATNQALFETMTKVMEDGRMSVNEKHQWFEKFRRQHPEVYNARFHCTSL